MTIYALYDPLNGEPRYIGAAINPDVRFRAHLNSALRNPAGSKDGWILELRAQGLLPELKILEVTDDQGAEERWIRKFLLAGANLLNETPTGRGVVGGRMGQGLSGGAAGRRALNGGRK